MVTGKNNNRTTFHWISYKETQAEGNDFIVWHKAVKRPLVINKMQLR
jgi:hypothetical protein